MAARNRGRSNGNEAGNNVQRRQRKLALLERDGDGVIAQCWECDWIVTLETIHVDRVVPGVDGGTYALSNCRVHCPSCSGRQGQRMTMEIRRRRRIEQEQVEKESA